MNDAKKAAIQTIDDHAALFCDVSRKDMGICRAVAEGISVRRTV